MKNNYKCSSCQKQAIMKIDYNITIRLNLCCSIIEQFIEFNKYLQSKLSMYIY